MQPKAEMVPNELESTNHIQYSGYAWRSPYLLTTARYDKLTKMQHFCNHGYAIYDPNATTKLYAKSACGCNNNMPFRKTYVHVSYSRTCYPDSGQALAMYAKVLRWRHRWIHYFSCLKCRFCLNTVWNNTSVVKCCSGKACNWCVSLDIASMLACS